MSLVEAAAALDRLLRGHHEGGAPPNVPPYAPPLATPDDGNLLPTLFPNTNSARARLCSTPTGKSLPSMILPWENLEEEQRTPFCRNFSPLPSPIPIPTPSLPALPSPQYPPHWMVTHDTWPFEEEAPQVEALSQSAKTTDELPKKNKRRRRKANRAYSESAAGCASLDEDFVPLDPEKYKTELCRSFQVHGNCRYGARCNYAHGLQELRGASRHGKYKTRNCQSYHQTGYCRYGARCSFIHDPEEGILKCSIANKEVLAALHYRPSSEEFPHTANITWRLLETPGSNVPELHFISSTPTKEYQSLENSCDKIFPSPNPLQGHINLLISSDDVFDDNGFFTCTLPLCNEVSALNSAILLEENLSLLRSLQASEEPSSKSDSSLASEREAKSFLSPLNAAVLVNHINPRSSTECSLVFPIESPDASPVAISPVEKVVIEELSSEGEAPEEVSTKQLEYPAEIYFQDIKDFDVVQAILREAPLYSATVWSDGADKWQMNSENQAVAHSEQSVKDKNLITSKVEIIQATKKSAHNKAKGEYYSGKRRTKNLFRRRRKAERRLEFEGNENVGFIETNKDQTQNDNVFSGDSENEGEEIEVSTGAAGADGDDWSEKSSLHLADLLRSLRLREGSNQLLPWSKPGRRCSSDGSSAGPLSVKEARSTPSSPASPRQHDMTKYKTELCRSFQYNGYCSYGDACLYAHGQIDLRSYPKHPMYRTKQCFSFHNKGFCLYGSRCQFLHDLELSNDLFQVRFHSYNLLCLPFCVSHRCNYAHGLQELRGASRHGKYKTRNCQSYHQTGYCRYGARCSFIHDPEEGILKCSIANKEVLAALHYRPSSEEFPHTANITWRLLETPGSNVPELHFISSTPTKEYQSLQHSCDEILPSPNPLQGHINLLISSDDVFDDNGFFTCTLPLCNEVSALNSAILLEENLSLLRSLQASEEPSSKSDSSLASEREAKSFLSPLNAAVLVNHINPRNSTECSLVFPIESPDASPLAISPVEKVVIEELSSEGEAPEEVSTKQLEYPAEIYFQDIKDFDVVQAILREAPLYSATVWSDGADKWQMNSENQAVAHSEQSVKDKNLITSKVEIIQATKKSAHNKAKGEYYSGKRRMKNLFRRRRKAERRLEFEGNENVGFIETSKDQTQNDNVFSGDSENEGEEIEVSTGAAGADGDDWSEKSSLHLADLLRSLRLREGSNQLLPWSKPGRRCSSDGSSAGPLSVKEARSTPSSPASPRQHDMTKYKTELCRSFQYNGYCSYGDACLYAHGQIDLRSYPKHPMYRTKQCFSFHNKGFCLYGSRCQFLHDLE
ncbi:uncharacterized protein [Palaemon carinicauda]|uniref:uncharacterized protein n=1 Tax=Palaemon carinicauda TaxID=392227 RepID=UPI0035B5E1A0